MGSKGGAVTVGYKYFVGVHFVLCHATADRLSRIRVDKRVVFQNQLPTEGLAGAFRIDKPTLFGGEAREGGIEGAFDFMDGNPDQIANSYLSANISGLMPSFRGVAGVVLNQMYIGNNPYLKSWDFRIQRLHKTFNGQEQWNDPEAAIIFEADPPEALVGQTDTYDTIVNDTVTATSQAPFGNILASSQSGLFPAIGVTDHVNGDWSGPNSIWAVDTELVLRKTITITKLYPALRLYGRVDNAIQILIDGAVAVDINFEANAGGGLIVFDVFIPGVGIGDHVLTVKVKDEAAPTENPPFIYASNTYMALRIDGVFDRFEAMNPAHIIRECLTDPDFGMGVDAALIDTPSFEAVSSVLFNDEKMGLCMIWSAQESVEKFIDRVKRHMNAELFVDRVTGLYTLKLIRPDFDINFLPVLDASNIARISEFKRPAFGELTNSVTVTYYDLVIADSATVTVQDIALIQEQRNEIITTVQYPGFPTGDLASRAAQRDLQVLSSPLITCTIFTNAIAENFNLGSVFVLNWPDYGVSSIVMRVTGANYGNGQKNVVRLECVQDVFTAPPIGIVPSSDIDFVDPSVIPSPVPSQIAFEVPYFEMVQVTGQTTVDSTLANNNNIGLVGVAPERAIGSINARMFTDSGAGFKPVGIADFVPTATLVAAITKSDASFDIANIDEVADVPLGSWFQIDNELLSIETFDGLTITVKRGLLDTVPELHSIDSILYFWDEFSANGDPTEYVASDIVDIKVAPITGSGELPISIAPKSTVTLDSRAIRPYPPGNVTYNSLVFPAALDGIIFIDWASRNRLQQTSGILLDWFAGSITPEAGVTYTLKVLDASLVEVFSETGITDLTKRVGPFFPQEDHTIEIFSVRDGFDSIQIVSHTFTYTSIIIDNTAIPSEEAFGTAVVVDPQGQINAPSIASTESFGTTVVDVPSAITVRSVGLLQDFGSGLTINVPLPAAIVLGDLLVACVMHQGVAGYSTPSGWTLEFSTAFFAFSNQRVMVFSKVATGSESGTEAFTTTNAFAKAGYIFSIENATSLGSNAVQASGGASATVTTTWTGPTIYVYDWDMAPSTSATITALTNVDIEYGVKGPLTDLQMYGAFDAAGDNSLVTASPGIDTQAVAIQLL